MKLRMPKLEELLPIPTYKTEPAPEAQQQRTFSPEMLGEKKVFLSWESHSRPVFQDMNKKYVRTLTTIGIAVAILLVIMQEFFLILAILSMVFVYQAISKTPPEIVKCEISNHGVMFSDEHYFWHQLKHFFFFEHSGDLILALDIYDAFPGRLFMIIPRDKSSEVQEYISNYLPFLTEQPKTGLEKIYENLMSKLNLGDQD